MALDLKRVYETAEFSDLVIVAGEREFKVHKLVVCQFAPIKALVAEAGDAFVHLPESSRAIEPVVGYMYGFDYPVNFDLEVQSQAQLKLIVDTAVAAEQYEVHALVDSITTAMRIATAEIVTTELKLGLAYTICSDDLRGTMVKRIIYSAMGGVVRRRSAVLPPAEEENNPPEAAEEGGGGALQQPDALTEDEEAAAMGPPAKRVKIKQTPLALKLAEERKKAAVANAHIHCHCKAREDNQYLIQCGRCYKWWHPGCIGKGQYAEGTYRSHRLWAQGKDVDYYVDREFRCAECVPLDEVAE